MVPPTLAEPDTASSGELLDEVLIRKLLPLAKDAEPLTFSVPAPAEPGATGPPRPDRGARVPPLPTVRRDPVPVPDRLPPEFTAKPLELAIEPVTARVPPLIAVAPG